MNRKYFLILAGAILSAVSLFGGRGADYSARHMAPAPDAQSVKLDLELDRPIVPSNSEETVILKIGLNGMRHASSYRTPLNIALVIDRSGSMSGDKIRQARNAAHQAVDQLLSDDVVSLIVYGSEAVTYWPASRAGDGRGLHQAINRIETSGNTNLWGGVQLGAAELRKRLRGDFVHRVILLSDGLANHGPSSPAELAGLGTELRAEGIAVSTVGLGLDYNEDLMAGLARRSDGNTYFVENSRDLPRVFAEEFGDAMNVVARELIVEVVFPAGVRPLRVIGRDGNIGNQRAEVRMNQLYGGREQFALIVVQVEPGHEAESRELARAELSYLTQAGASRIQLKKDVNIAFTGDIKVVRAQANHQVQTDYSLNRLAEVKEAVIRLNDQGRAKEAQRELESLVASQRQLSASYANAEVAALADQVEAEADEFRLRGMDNATRKSYRADSLQISRQQKRP